MGACLEGTLQGPSHVTHCDMANYTHSGMNFDCTLAVLFTVLLLYFYITLFVLLKYSLCTYRVPLVKVEVF